MMKNRFTKGFSLIELVVVLAIVGLLSAFAASRLFDQSMERTKIKQSVGVAHSIKHAIEMYSNEFIMMPSTGAFLTAPHRISPFLYPVIPGSGTTSFLDALHTTLSGYLAFNPKNSLGSDPVVGVGWGIYTLSPAREGYTLVVRARDRLRTPITIVKRYQPGLPNNMTEFISARYQGEEVTFP